MLQEGLNGVYCTLIVKDVVIGKFLAGWQVVARRACCDSLLTGYASFQAKRAAMHLNYIIVYIEGVKEEYGSKKCGRIYPSGSGDHSITMVGEERVLVGGLKSKMPVRSYGA